MRPGLVKILLPQGAWLPELTQMSDSSLGANAETRDAVESVAGQRLTNNWSGLTLCSVISCNCHGSRFSESRSHDFKGI
jgi:hypothetical protein